MDLEIVILSEVKSRQIIDFAYMWEYKERLQINLSTK